MLVKKLKKIVNVGKIEVMKLLEYKLFECKIGMNNSRVLYFNDCKLKCV